MTRMEKGRPSRTWLVFAASCGFLAGMLVMAALFAIFPDQTRPALASANSIAAPAPAETRAVAPSTASAPPATGPTEVRPTPSSEPPGASAPEEPQAVAFPSIGVDPIADLKGRDLELPVKGADDDDIKDMFDDMRGGSRRHEALDILAPRNTPVVAVEDGTIARLFFSKAGGITIYQADPTNTYIYYYAHLEKYVDGLKEGQKVKRGELIGYVGTTGNAPPNTPHLHFAIFKMTDEKRWWEGTPINPFQVLR
jgi:murein DD-endopeptidase MepM/ murein hydrolase activator NlpD